MYNKNLSVILVIVFSFLVLAGCGGGGSDINLYDVTITGHVYDYWSGLPVEDALVLIDSDIVGTTNSNGNFQVNQLVEYSSTLTIKKEGYITEIKNIVTTDDGEITIPDIRLMDSYEFSGSISGYIRIIGVASESNRYENLKVMATNKDVTNDGTIYWVLSNICNDLVDGKYYIENAKINEPLTVIGFIDNNNNDIIDHEEFFGELNISSLSSYQSISVDIDMTPYTSSENKEIIFKKPLKGE